MNRKFEDELLRLAFEDMTPEQASRLEQEALSDPEAARVLTQYREMRAGLRALADVPAEQLSKERLRDAILTRGLAPRRSPRLGWAWMPVMAASLAAVVFLARPHSTPTPQVAVAQHNNIFDVPSVTPSGPVAVNVPPQPASGAGVAIKVQPIIPPKLQVASVVHRTRRAGTISDKDMERLVSLIRPTGGAPVTPTSGNDSDSRPPALVAPDSIEATPPIVLIDGEKDGNTGASRATEVESTSNVVVGG